MQRLQAFKFELRPDGQQERQMRRFAGSCRFVFNKALALQKERHEQGEKKLGYAGLRRLLAEWRNSQDMAWLADAPVHPLQYIATSPVFGFLTYANIVRIIAYVDRQTPNLQ